MSQAALISEIKNCEKLIEEYSWCYGIRESKCPKEFKFIMLFNGYPSPFVALNELLNRIYSNEQILKRTGKLAGYKSRYREMRGILHNASCM